MKCGGLVSAFEIANIAKQAEIDLFWGCNDESDLSISAALHAAFACPNTKYLDLDGSFDLLEDYQRKWIYIRGRISFYTVQTRLLMNENTLKRSIKPLSAVFLVVSAIVGSGIYKKVAPMMDQLHSPTLVLLCWTLAGVLSLMGALSSAELASMMPGSGGEYIYFNKIYGKFFSFIYGWASLAVMKTATIAALAYVFSESLHEIIPQIHSMGGASIKIIASLLIIVLSYVNYRGVSFGEKLSRYFIAGIVLSILAFVILAVFSGKGNMEHFTQTAVNAPTGWPLFAAMFAASLSAFWGYEGWNNIGFIGEEVNNPQRNLPLALGIGTLIVIVLYLLINAVYLFILAPAPNRIVGN